MRHLYKIFRERNATAFEQVYRERFQSESAVHVGLSVKPMNHPHSFPLFYVPTNDMLDKISKIYTISRTFQQTFLGLPTVAQRQFINECLVEELYNTNELEGIRSSREEIARSAKELMLHKKSNKRFESMITSYIRLINSDIDFPRFPADVRIIYDDITKGEIDGQELPDGEIFRKDVTYILKKSGSGKVVHQGITPELEIIRAMEQFLALMNDNLEIPPILKAAVGHYYFGYIHPFYDGNGRTSRFISSMYMAYDLGNIATLSLSRGCNTYKTKYLEAFEVTNSIRSRGELNYFIEVFLDIMLQTLLQMNEELQEKNELLKVAVTKLDREVRLKEKDKMYTNLMYWLAQNHFFDTSGGLTIKELAHIAGKSEATIRKIAKDLIEMSLADQIGERPVYLRIHHSYLEE